MSREYQLFFLRLYAYIQGESTSKLLVKSAYCRLVLPGHFCARMGHPISLFSVLEWESIVKEKRQYGSRLDGT